ncbi:uracil-DNA glycosylase [Flavobacteriaceae bacterium]|nr:uracil-DNA glycosylase [Flavobacteriaceae bacterium]
MTGLKNWLPYLETEVNQDYFKRLEKLVNKAREEAVIFPPEGQVFRAFELCSLEDIKVVILGQDPYHGLNQANGLAFSVNHGISLPPSLKNIYKQLNREGIDSCLIDGELSLWAHQGVFLLNTVLTVEAHRANSHKSLGWQKFTDYVIQSVSKYNNRVIFMLWGGQAHKKESLIDSDKHLIIKTGHPSPLSANRGYWFDNNQFTQANCDLKKRGILPIAW